MTEKELEKLFKGKLDSREFAFNPENWQRMEAILDNAAVNKGAYYWRSSAAILLFGALVASLIYFTPGEKLGPQDNNIAAPSYLIQDDALEQPASNSTMENSIADDAIEAPVSPQSPVNADVASETISPDVSTSNTELVSEESQSDPVVKTEDNTYASSSAGAEETVNPVSITPQESVVSLTPELFAFEGPLSLDPKGFEFTYGPVDPLGMGLMESPYIAPDLSTKDVLNRQGLIFNVGALAGSGSSNAYGLQAGLGYRKTMNYGLGLEVAVNYVMMNNVNIESQSDSVFFHFGMERVRTEEVNRRLDYVEIPLNLSYQFLPKHSIGVGGYAAMLVNVQRETQRTTWASKSGVSVENAESNGYLDEFDRWDLGLSAFYRYSFSPKLQVGLHLRQGLRDITRDVTEDYAEDHTNFNTRLVLEYRLF